VSADASDTAVGACSKRTTLHQVLSTVLKETLTLGQMTKAIKLEMHVYVWL
jgi:hypothetical protein